MLLERTNPAEEFGVQGGSPFYQVVASADEHV